MLKSRFADTISRAQQKMKVLKDDPMKMKQEKQILKTRSLLQDKEKKEAANAELKEQRERATNSDLTTSSTVVADSAMLAQDTIKTVVVNSAKNVSPMKIHNEKKRYLERRQLEENAKTSGSSSPATKMKAKIELKKKREAARIALENMENAAGIQLNLEAQNSKGI
ncbi:hypothetical protein GOBAR_AA38111 [Gossypium barbadense]|uniref:Uncharacterized protein n=2 Tax=Gossypium TaxID=3633 RepID=A0A2P5VUT4_GOSBA|nr:hypothetical protein GOBAR_AA38111 [Gossypium barbadense]